MTGSVDEVKKIFFAVVSVIGNADGTSLYSNATLTLKLHIVKQLRLHITGGNGVCLLKNTVGERTFAVVNVGNYAEISDFILWKCQINHLFADILQEMPAPLADRPLSLFWNIHIYNNTFYL